MYFVKGYTMFDIAYVKMDKMEQKSLQTDLVYPHW